jgi:ABC-type ATPase with predicted acetyltransferase domain
MNVLVLTARAKDSVLVQLFASEDVFMREEFEALTPDEQDRLRLGYEVASGDVVFSLDEQTVAE